MERRILAQRLAGKQLVERFVSRVTALVRRVGRRGFALLRRRPPACRPAPVAAACSGQVRIVAATCSIRDAFPLDLYERVIGGTAARHAHLLQVCRADDALTATVCGMPPPARASAVLIERTADR